MGRLFLSVFISGLILCMVSCQELEETPIENDMDLIEFFNGEGLFILGRILRDHPDILESIHDHNEYTIMAPTDEAFNKAFDLMGVDNLDAFIKRVGGDLFFKEYMKTHILEYNVASRTLGEDLYLLTSSGISLGIDPNSSTFNIMDAFGGGAKVIKANLFFQGGRIHVIDAVLVPNYALERDNGRNGIIETATTLACSEFIGAIISVDGLLNRLEEQKYLSIFVPSNTSFQLLFGKHNVNSLEQLIDRIGIDKFSRIIEYHIVPKMAWFATDGNHKFKSMNGQHANIIRDGNIVVFTDFHGEDGYISTNYSNADFNNGIFYPISGVMVPDLNSSLP